MNASWETFGFRLWQAAPVPMRDAHQHGEIELNLVERGELTYLFGGRALSLGPGQLLVFWGARPHRLIACAPDTRCVILTLPLAAVLRFDLPAPFTDRVLGGEPVLGPADAAQDGALFGRWLSHPDQDAPEHQRILDLELEARLRRLALALRGAGPPDPGRSPLPAGRRLQHAARLAQAIAERHLDPELSTGALARQTGLNPNYATTLFRECFGLSMGAYLGQYRVAQAQRLLLTTDLSVLDIVAASGFGSVSRFYAAFRAACGQTPRQYRRRAGTLQDQADS